MTNLLILALCLNADRTMTVTVATPYAGRLTVQTRASHMSPWDNWANASVPRGTNAVKVKTPDLPACYVRALLQ